MNEKKIVFVWISVLTTVFVCLGFPFSGGIQEEPKHETVVVLKLVQVYVMDKKGLPVADLSREDFVLFDNGIEQKITDFEQHLLGKLSPEEKILPSGPVQARMKRKFFILLDTLSNDDTGILESKKAALHFIETQLIPGDEIGYLTFDPLTGLNLKVYLTSDFERVKQAIRKAERVPLGKTPPGLTLEDEFAKAEKDMKSHKAESRDQGINPNLKSGGQEGPGNIADDFVRPFHNPGLAHVRRGLGDMTREITEVAKALAFIPGQKSILFFSGGSVSRAKGAFAWMGRELAAANCQVFAVNAMKKRGNFRGIFDRLDLGTLAAMAELSGGKMYEDIGEYESIAEDIQTLTGNYYVLGYYIDTRWDGAFHRIQVKVKNPQYLVSAQAGYYNPKPFLKMSDLEKSLHLVDLVLGDNPYSQAPEVFSARILVYSGGNTSNSALIFCLSSEQLQDILDGQVEVVAFIIDATQTIVDSYRGEVDFSGIPAKNISMYSCFSLKPGQYECRVAVRNMKSGRGAVGLAGLEIPEPSTQKLEVFPSLFLRPLKDVQYIRLSRQNQAAPSLGDIYPFLAKNLIPVVGEIPINTKSLMAVTRVFPPAGIKPRFDMKAFLKSLSSGRESPIEVFHEAIENRDAAVCLLSRIVLPQLKPGGYELILHLSESLSGLSNATSFFFEVR
ncbi:MAG: VWA domain-containing protein [Candidatus Aminicenantes bacterium]|nr:VWA domain-containing protein [Candidatus Aminicenantes bacterium]